MRNVAFLLCVVVACLSGAVSARTLSQSQPADSEVFQTALAQTIRRCWVVDPGSEASKVAVTIAFSLASDGTLSDAPRLVSATEGSEDAVKAAFESARRAILRCGGMDGGFALPPARYEEWREVEITFDAQPEGGQ